MEQKFTCVPFNVVMGKEKRGRFCVIFLSTDLIQDLNPGASEDLLKAVEATIGIKLPENFRNAYAEHNGEVEGTGGYVQSSTKY